MKLKTLTLLVLFTNAIFAQKVDLDKFSITTSYRQFPSMVVDTTYKTYSIDAPAYADISYATVPLTDAQNINIEGLKKLQSGGHYVVKISFIDARIERNGVEDVKKTEKNKDGAVVREWTVYKPFLEYTISFQTDLYDYTGKKITVVYIHTGNNKGSGGQPQKYYPAGSDKEFTSYSDASNYYNNNYRSIFKKLVGDEFSTHVKTSASKLNSLIGFQIITQNSHLWMNDSKKHPEYDKQQAIIAEFKTWSSQINGSRSLTDDEVKKANEFLDYFESLKKKYATDEKADKKLRYSAFYNKAIIYLDFLDNPSKAYDEGAGLIANEYDERDGKGIQKDADNVKMAMDKAKRKTRHFSIDLSQVKGPKE